MILTTTLISLLIKRILVSSVRLLSISGVKRLIAIKKFELGTSNKARGRNGAQQGGDLLLYYAVN